MCGRAAFSHPGRSSVGWWPNAGPGLVRWVRDPGRWPGHPKDATEIQMAIDSQPADNRIDSPRREPRLPPGQVQTQKWPVLHYGSVPRVDLTKWELRVDGLVKHPQRWTWAEF